MALNLNPVNKKWKISAHWLVHGHGEVGQQVHVLHGQVLLRVPKMGGLRPNPILAHETSMNKLYYVKFSALYVKQ